MPLDFRKPRKFSYNSSLSIFFIVASSFLVCNIMRKSGLNITWIRRVCNPRKPECSLMRGASGAAIPTSANVEWLSPDPVDPQQDEWIENGGICENGFP